MEKVALNVKEEYKIFVNVMIKCYKDKIAEWNPKEKKTIKTIINYINKIFKALPYDEVYIEKIDLSQVYEFLLRSFRDQQKIQYETQGLCELVSEFEDVIRLYKEVVQGVSENFEVKLEYEGLDKVNLQHVVEEFKNLKQIEALFNQGVKKIEQDLEESRTSCLKF